LIGLFFDPEDQDPKRRIPHADFLIGLFFDPEDQDPKRRLTSNGLNGFISQIELFNTA
jgi:hypothetical protein